MVYLVNVNRSAVRHRTGDFDMVSFMARNRCRVVDGDHLLVLVGYEHWLLATLDALLRTLRVRRIRALRSALGVADPSVPTAVFRSSHGDHAAQKQSQNYQRCFLHVASPAALRRGLQRCSLSLISSPHTPCIGRN